MIKFTNIKRLNSMVRGDFSTLIFSCLRSFSNILHDLLGEKDLARKFIVMLAPYLLILTSGWDWMFVNYGVDSSNYSAIFLNFGNPEFFADGYKFGRLPWVLSGYFVFSVFSPKVAIILLASSYFSLALLGTYIFIRNMLSSSIAFVISIALGFFTQFHMVHANGVFYHNLASATFLIWSLAVLSKVFNSDRKNGKYIFYSGVFSALALHSNITVINFLPIFFVFFYLIDDNKSLKLIVGRLVVFLCAGLITTLVLMAINWIIRDEPVFFSSLVKLVRRALEDPNFQKQWWESWGSMWFLKKRHLLVLAGIYFGAIALMAFVGQWKYALRSKNGQRALYCVGQYIFLFTLWILWQTQGQTALNFDYFSFPLIIPSFICLGGLLFLVTKGSFKLNPKLDWVVPLIFLIPAISGIGLHVTAKVMPYLYLIASIVVFTLIICKRSLTVFIWAILFSIMCGLNNDSSYYKLNQKANSLKNWTLAVVEGQKYVSNIAPWPDIKVFYSSSEVVLDQNGKSLGRYAALILNTWRPIVNIWEKDLFSPKNIYYNEVVSLVKDEKTLVVISQDETNYEKLKVLLGNYNTELVEIDNYPIKLEKGGSFSIRSFKALKTK